MISYGFNNLVPYLGGRVVSIMATILFIIIIRIGIAFVFKLFRMNITYKTAKRVSKK